MGPEERRLFIAAMIVNAQARIAGMQASDMAALANGTTNVYTEEAYESVITEFGLGHNQVIDYLRG